MRGWIVALGLLGCSCSASPIDFESPELPWCFDVDPAVERELPHVYESIAVASDAVGKDVESPGLLLACPHRIYFGKTVDGACRGDERLTLSGSVCLATDYYAELYAPEVPVCGDGSEGACCDPRKAEFYLDAVLEREFARMLGGGDEGDAVPCGRAGLGR